MKKCIIIPDSFKGSLSATLICNILKERVNAYFPHCETVCIPVADGGEGTVDCFLGAMPNGKRIDCKVSGPYSQQIDSFYGLFGQLAVIEMAAAAGLPLVEDNKNPATTSTFGVGELILHAVKNGATKILLGLGGSCTNDGGCGCAAAVGVKFIDDSGNEFVPTGETLGKIAKIDCENANALLKNIEITAMCDVENPLYGKMGAAYIFGPQKGADEQMVELLDKNLEHLGAIIQANCEVSGIAQMAGSGAAGGFGAGVIAFLGGQLKSGIEAVLDIVEFDGQLAGTDIVFTGEGKIDSQSLNGKVISGVASRTKAHSVPLVAIVGDVGDDAVNAYDIGVSAIFSINRVAVPFSVAKLRSQKDLYDTFDDIMRLMSISRKI